MPKDNRGHLLRVLGLGFGLSVIIGNTIGGGILRTPGTIAEHLPNVWLFLGVWLAGGVYALLGSISYAEIATMIPRAGGQYAFARYALGDYAGFVVGWADWLSTCGSTAAVGILIGAFSVALFPSLNGPYSARLIACGVAIVFGLLQWRGIVMGSTAQNITSLMKALGFLILIVAAFAMGTGGAFSQPAAVANLGGLSLFTALILSLQSVIYTYDGWYGVVYFSEEVVNPGNDIPKSIIGGVLSIIAIYLLINIGLLYVLPMSQLVGTDFAVGTAANAIFGRHGDSIFRWLTIASMLSTINACHLMATRTMFALSRDGLFIRQASAVNKGGTPATALLLTVLTSLVFIWLGETFDKVITVVAFFFVANYSLTFISVFVLRRREPDRQRPYRAWGYPWTTGVALIGSILFLAGAVASDTRNSLYALLLLAVSYPLFRLLRR
ncbi:MAG TPA: APC family permease [Pyrinomonadaceae bacterium]